jgi:hypothetical protein
MTPNAVTALSFDPTRAARQLPPRAFFTNKKMQACAFGAGAASRSAASGSDHVGGRSHTRALETRAGNSVRRLALVPPATADF